MNSELAGRINFYIEKLSGHGWLMPNTVRTLKDACKRIEQLETALQKLLSVKGDHMTACDRTMGATHPCTCGVNDAALLLAGKNDKIICLACHNHAYAGEKIQHRKDCLLFPRRDDTCAP